MTNEEILENLKYEIEQFDEELEQKIGIANAYRKLINNDLTEDENNEYTNDVINYITNKQELKYEYDVEDLEDFENYKLIHNNKMKSSEEIEENKQALEESINKIQELNRDLENNYRNTPAFEDALSLDIKKQLKMLANNLSDTFNLTKTSLELDSEEQKEKKLTKVLDVAEATQDITDNLVKENLKQDANKTENQVKKAKKMRQKA